MRRHSSPVTATRRNSDLQVLHLGKFFPPVRGGIEQVTFDIVQGIGRLGIPVDVLCFSSSARTRKDDFEGCSVVRAGTWGVIASQPVSLSLFWELWKHRRRQDGLYLIHLHVPNPLAAIYLLALPRRPRFIVHWHSDIVKQTKGAALFSWMEQKLLAASQAIIVTSEAYRDHSLPLRAWHHKTHVIPLGITDMLPASGQSIACPAQSPIILAVGRLVSYKGFATLLEAMAVLPSDHRLHLVGTGPLLKELKTLVTQLKISDRVLFLGGLDREALIEQYEQCTLFCLPSLTRAEAFGVVLLEAMSMGKPIVTTRIEGSATQWVNRQGVTGYNVEAGNGGALASAIQSITGSPERAAKMGEAARARYIEHFTAQQMVDRIATLYRQMYCRK